MSINQLILVTYVALSVVFAAIILPPSSDDRSRPTGNLDFDEVCKQHDIELRYDGYSDVTEQGISVRCSKENITKTLIYDIESIEYSRGDLN